MSPAETFTAPSAGASTSLRQKQAASVRGRSDNNASCRTAVSECLPSLSDDNQDDPIMGTQMQGKVEASAAVAFSFIDTEPNSVRFGTSGEHRRRHAMSSFRSGECFVVYIYHIQEAAKKWPRPGMVRRL